MKSLFVLFTSVTLLSACASQIGEVCQREVRRGKFLSQNQCLAYYGQFDNQDPLRQQNQNKNMVRTIERSSESYYMEQERNIYCGIKPLVPNHCRLHCIEGVWKRDCGED